MRYAIVTINGNVWDIWSTHKTLMAAIDAKAAAVKEGFTGLKIAKVRA